MILVSHTDTDGVDALAKAKSLMPACTQVLEGADADLRVTQAMLSLGIANQALAELQKSRDLLAAVIDALENAEL